MRLEIRPRDRRALLLLVLSLVVYLFLTEVALPIYDGLAAAAESALDKEDQLRRYRRAVVRKANYEQLLEEAQRRVAEGEARLIRGDNPPWPPPNFSPSSRVLRWPPRSNSVSGTCLRPGSEMISLMRSN